MSRVRRLSLAVSFLLVTGLPSGSSASEEEPRRILPEGATAPLFNDLGDYHWPVTTKSKMAQRYFDQGLILTYGFNHAEAARSFREAQRLDPGCAMCFWGEAYALGPNINKPMDDGDVSAAWKTTQAALEKAAGATERERAIIRALATRYAEEPVADRSPLDRAYADAMREVARAHADDLDVQALFAEALMTTMPWDYYLADGSPKPETKEVLAALEKVLDENPDHPGAIHFYIHAVEPSDDPHLAEAPADRLRNLVPGAGHLVHMPSHIYLRVGRYHDASIANEKAAAADESYITQCRAQGFYPAAYYPHNIDFLQSAAAFEGRSELAITQAKKLVETIPEEAVDELPIVEEFFPRDLVALARFGKWDEILARPQPNGKLRYLTGMWHYARGLAFAAKGTTKEAKEELLQVVAFRDEWQQKEFVFLSGSTPAQLLTIASHVLEARIAGVSGDWDAAATHLTEAVTLQDSLPYTEPPPWYFPSREALGHALLMAKRPAEAETVYRKQLEKTPRNGWSLYGLAKSLRAQGKKDAAAEVERRFEKAWQRADVKLAASVF